MKPRALLFALPLVLFYGCRDEQSPVSPSPSAPSAHLATSFSAINVAELVFPPSPNTAQVVAGSIRLTSQDPIRQTGAVWHNTKHHLANGFTTTFTFSMPHTGSYNGDGLAFVIQDYSSAAYVPQENCGSCLGYSGMPRSLAVEFDTFGDNDSGGNHVAIHSRGSLVNFASTGRLGSAYPAANLNDGMVHTATVKYVAPSGTAGGHLDVYLDNSANPVITVALNLGTYGVLDTQGKAWVGFTGATGDAVEEHNIHTWSFAASLVNALPVISSTGGNVQGGSAPGGSRYAADKGSSITFTAAASDPDGDALTFTWNFGDQTSAVSSSTPAGTGPQTTSATHTYPAHGRYPVTLTVTDSHGGSTTATTEVAIGHEVLVTVGYPNVVGSSRVPMQVTAIRTDVPDGQGAAYITRTDSLGKARLRLSDGGWMFHVRNLSDAGQAYNGFILPVAPIPEGKGTLTTASDDYNRIGALHDPRVGASGSLQLTPANFELMASTSNDYELTGDGSFDPKLITINQPAGGPGATVACTLRDENGNPVTVSGTENIFTIFPFRANATLPPRNSASPGHGLQRAILFSAGTFEANGGCSISGIPNTEGFTAPAVLESNTITVTDQNGVQKQVQIVESFSSDGTGTEPVIIVAQPARSFVDYITDPLNDGVRDANLALVSYGWKANSSGAPTDVFAASASAFGPGPYTLEVRYTGPGFIDNSPQENSQVKPRTITARVMWQPNQKRWNLLDVVGIRRSFVNVTGFATGTGEGDEATANWEITLPGVTQVQLRVEGGSGQRFDSAPDQGHRSATKTQNGNSWDVMGAFDLGI